MTVEPWIKTGHCQTRDGREVRIYATDGDPHFPVHGAVLVDGTWRVQQWMGDGRSCPFAHGSPYDLVPIETTSRETWGRHPSPDDSYQSKALVEHERLNVTRDHEGRVTKVELAE